MSSDKLQTKMGSRRCIGSKSRVFVRAAGEVWSALRSGSFLVSPFIAATELLSPSDFFGKRRVLVTMPDTPASPDAADIDTEEHTDTEPVTWTTKVVERSDWKRSIAWETTPKTSDGLFKWRRDAITVTDLDRDASDRPRCSVQWTGWFTPTKAQLQVEAAALLAEGSAGSGAGAGAGEGTAADGSDEKPTPLKHPPLDLGILPFLLTKLGGSGEFTSLSLIPSSTDDIVSEPTETTGDGAAETKTDTHTGTDTDTDTDTDTHPTPTPPNTVPGLHAADSTECVMALDPSTNTFSPVLVTSLTPGQVVQVTSGDVFPADLLLVHSTAPTQTAVNQKALDGSNTLRLRQVKSADVTVDGTTRPLQSMWDGVGSGDPGPLSALSTLGALSVPPPAADGSFKLRLSLTGKAPDGSDKKPIEFGTEQLLAAGAKLVMTDSVIGLVVYVGPDTWYSKNQCAVNAVIRERRFGVTSAAKKAWEKIEKTLSNQKPWKLPAVVGARRYEEMTGLKWDDKFTDVPDDGNCLMHAVWLGLTTLERLHPELKLSPDLPSDPVSFRTDALDRLSADAAYMSTVDEMIRLWVSLDAALLMTSVEDFFVLPSDFQSELLSVNQAVSLGGFEGVDFVALVDKYVDLQKRPTTVNGRETFVPLGEAELGGLLRLYSFRLQTVKSEAIRESTTEDAGGAGGVDPRTIHPKHMSDRSPSESSCPKDVLDRRIVRILNVSTNHYMVHLAV